MIQACAIHAPVNQVLAWLEACDSCVANYEGQCVELVGDFIDGRPGWRMAYLEPERGHLLLPAVDGYRFGWKWHAVAVDPDGLLHDPWMPDLVLPLADYLDQAFPGQLVLHEFDPGKED